MIYNPKKPDGKNVLTIATETVQRGPEYLTVEPKTRAGWDVLCYGQIQDRRTTDTHSRTGYNRIKYIAVLTA